LTRREFVAGTAGALVSSGRIQARATELTARQLVERIQSRVGIPWRATTVDGFKAGDPATAVTGIATMAMPTIDLLRRAVAASRNMIITQQPTFYSANDEPVNRATDAVYLEKKSLLDRNRVVVWRFSDHWNARRPNDAAAALAARLGWRQPLSPADESIYQIPETTFGALLKQVRNRLAVKGGLRSVGDPGMRVRTVLLNPGAATVPIALEGLRRADVILTGEPREWEVVPYVLDTWQSGRGKGLISVGRLVSEAPGVEACARWLKAQIPEVPVEAMALPDPYWNPPS
jgi:putative NIF3 family GTP cyclohydrolase 1 type 2